MDSVYLSEMQGGNRTTYGSEYNWGGERGKVKKIGANLSKNELSLCIFEKISGAKCLKNALSTRLKTAQHLLSG